MGRHQAASRNGGTTLEQLRGDILSGRRVPSSRLAFSDLVAAYGCSTGVAREALQRLAGEGLVEAEAKQGFRVISVSIPDLIDLTDARCEFESIALRYAIEAGSFAWEGEAIAAMHVLDRTPQYDQADDDRFSEEWVTAHNAFHRALLTGCPNRRILSVASGLREAAELYRRWSTPLADRDRDISGEHHAILDSVLERDGDRAINLLQAHIRRTTERLIPRLTETEPAAATG
jgi:DNA-binding GntR family transcriptional regulator